MKIHLQEFWKIICREYKDIIDISSSTYFLLQEHKKSAF